MNKHLISFIFFFISFVIVAFGQPAWSSFLPYFSALFGYALFWFAMLRFSKKWQRFFFALLWFFAVQAIQLSWMTSIEYQGILILLVYIFLCVALGMQFGLLSMGIPKDYPLTIYRCFALSGAWVLLEWMRLFFLSGFSWNPVGLALTQDRFSIQFSSLLGIFGLSFFVILINLLLLRAIQIKKVHCFALFFITAILPFGYGIVYRNVYQTSSPKFLSIALVQTGLLPEEKENYSHRILPIPPIKQWADIFHFLKKNPNQIDLIVLPEVVVPYGTYKMIYPAKIAQKIWKQIWGESQSLPSGKKFITSDGKYVNNAFFAKALANHFHADVIAGFYDSDKHQYYNAALFFQPQTEHVSRYEKQVLVPIGEYFPFKWCREVAKKFGIHISFHPGEKTTIFSGTVPMGVSICYEETYSYIINDMRKNGAELLVNLTNDIWFPESKLAEQHFSHGKVRAVENGIPLVRACNSGVTVGVDCFGDIIDRFGSETHYERMKGALFLQIPKTHIHTFYAKAGDFTILSSSVFFIGLYFILRKGRKHF